MTSIHSVSKIQGLLRAEVETSPSLLTLYSRLLAMVSHVESDDAQAIQKHSDTMALRAQLADAMGTFRVPFLDLQSRRALCTVVAQCEDENESLSLCFAMIQHIGGEVEMYIQAVDVDPDQQLYKGLGMGSPAAVSHRVQPRLVIHRDDNNTGSADIIPLRARLEIPGS